MKPKLKLIKSIPDRAAKTMFEKHLLRLIRERAAKSKSADKAGWSYIHKTLPESEKKLLELFDKFGADINAEFGSMLKAYELSGPSAFFLAYGWEDDDPLAFGKHNRFLITQWAVEDCLARWQKYVD